MSRDTDTLEGDLLRGLEERLEASTLRGDLLRALDRKRAELRAPVCREGAPARASRSPACPNPCG